MITEGILIAIIAAGSAVAGNIITSKAKARSDTMSREDKSFRDDIAEMKEDIKSVTKALQENTITIASLETRLNLMDKKVDKHNNLVERTYALEKSLAKDEVKLDSVANKVNDL